MLSEVKTERVHYFLNENGFYHGEYRDWHKNGQLWEQAYFINGGRFGECKLWHDNGQIIQHCFYVDSDLHGECKTWDRYGNLSTHCFYINNRRVSIDEIPYPETNEERMLFKLKYNIPLLPVETVC